MESLTESYFYILLCLYNGRKHGYGIMRETAQLSQGRVKITSGTMYGAATNLLKKGWISEAKDADATDRKRLYELTDKGREVLSREIDRLHQLLESAAQVMQPDPAAAVSTLQGASQSVPESEESCPPRAYKAEIRIGTVRKLEKQDLQRVGEILNEGWRRTYREILSPEMFSEKWDLRRIQQLRQEFNTRRLDNYVYEEESIEGILTFGKTEDRDKPRAFEIWRIYVCENARMQGIGTKLLTFAEQEARRQGFQECLIWAFEKNTAACRFYERHGYVKDAGKYLEGDYQAEGVRYCKKL